MTPDWTPVLQEIGLWQARGKTARLWLRDDDAVKPSAQLERMAGLVGGHNIPITLAIIPEPADKALATTVKSWAGCTVAMHGFAHKNHAPTNDKKSEFGLQRTAQDVSSELESGFEKTQNLFGDRFNKMFVPPWNRIDQRHVSLLVKAGFETLSAFGWTATNASSTSICVLNTHIDIIDWKGTRAGKPIETLIKELADALAMARQHTYAPIGILCHHLVHDEQAWRFLQSLTDFVEENKNMRWCSAQNLTGR